MCVIDQPCARLVPPAALVSYFFSSLSLFPPPSPLALHRSSRAHAFLYRSSTQLSPLLLPHLSLSLYLCVRVCVCVCRPQRAPLVVGVRHFFRLQCEAVSPPRTHRSFALLCTFAWRRYFLFHPKGVKAWLEKTKSLSKEERETATTRTHTHTCTVYHRLLTFSAADVASTML